MENMLGALTRATFPTRAWESGFQNVAVANDFFAKLSLSQQYFAASDYKTTAKRMKLQAFFYVNLI